MYRINLDVIKKIICVEVSGAMTLDEFRLFSFELSDLVSKFNKGQYSLLVLANRLDPFTQDILPAFQQVIEFVLDWMNKIAIVYGNRTVTKMQSVRIESEARKNSNSNIPIMCFRTLLEAMNYINRR